MDERSQLVVAPQLKERMPSVSFSKIFETDVIKGEAFCGGVGLKQLSKFGGRPYLPRNDYRFNSSSENQICPNHAATSANRVETILDSSCVQ